MPCVNLQLWDRHEYQGRGPWLKPAGQTVRFQAALNWAFLPPSSLLCGSSRNGGINELGCESAFIRSVYCIHAWSKAEYANVKRMPVSRALGAISFLIWICRDLIIFIKII